MTVHFIVTLIERAGVYFNGWAETSGLGNQRTMLQVKGPKVKRQVSEVWPEQGPKPNQGTSEFNITFSTVHCGHVFSCF